MTNNPEKLLKITDVAARLNISRATAWRLIKAGELPAVRIGVKSVRVHPADLEAYIQARGKMTPGAATNNPGGGAGE